MKEFDDDDDDNNEMGLSALPAIALVCLSVRPVRLSVCLSVCQTRDSRLNCSTYRNALCI